MPKPSKVYTRGVDRIGKERIRQIVEEGWTAEHDSSHSAGELALAAVCYATPILLYRCEQSVLGFDFIDPWPESWDADWDKRPHEGNILRPNSRVARTVRIRQLEKAGALIAAEIDRLLAIGDRNA